MRVFLQETFRFPLSAELKLGPNRDAAGYTQAALERAFALGTQGDCSQAALAPRSGASGLPSCRGVLVINSSADPHMLSLPQGPTGLSLPPARRSPHRFPCSPFHRLTVRPARHSSPGSLHSTSVFAHPFSQTLLEAPEARRHPRRRLWGPRASTARPLPRGMFPFPAPTPRAEAPASPPHPLRHPL